MTTTYADFLAAKVDFDRRFGFTVADEDVHEILKPHQRDIVRWAVEGGRRAIFAAFGLGKSVMQLEIMRLILARHPEARWHSDCAECGWRIKPGDLAKYDERDNVVHVVCPESVGLRAVGEICPKCFIEKSKTGACGCEQ